MDELKAGIIGLRMGWSHANAVAATAGARVAAVCDIDEQRLAAAAREFSAEQAETDFRRVVANPALDFIVVATPDHFHCEHALAALEAGKHVLCEKPMAPSAQECRRMVEAARRAQRKLMIGHLVRFTPVFQILKRMRDEGEFGEVYYVGAEYQHDYSKVGGPWRFDPRVGRHVYLGGGCHAVDLMRYFLGEVTEVMAMGNHFACPQMPNDDCVAAIYRTAAGHIGRVLVAGGAKRPYALNLAIYGTRGSALASNVSSEAQVWLSRMEEMGDRWMTIPAGVESHPVRTQMSHFVGCIRDDLEPLINGEDGMRTVAAAVAAVESTHSGQLMAVEQI
jgi:predicted dehydrogenase